jgi:hypothetical protein
MFGHIEEDCDMLHTDLSPSQLNKYFEPKHPSIAHSKEINTGAFISSKRIFDYNHHVTTIMPNYPTFKRPAVMENDDHPFGSFVFDIDRQKLKHRNHLRLRRIPLV